MLNKVKALVYNFLLVSKKYILKYKSLCIGIVFSFIGGITLGIVCVLTVFFVETLVKRLKKDSSLESFIENPFKRHSESENESAITDEPFEGALLVAALGVFCTGNADFTGMQMTNRFSPHYSADWVSLCRIAAHSESLNGDLIVECLGATLLKNSEHDAIYEKLLAVIFTFLSIVEYEWSSERGIKPSEYLASLLKKPLLIKDKSSHELEKAYQLLGVSVDSNLETVKGAHRTLVSLYHPDAVIDLSDEQKKIAAEAFIRIQAAYESIIATY